jgi:hypothetical protein
MRAHEAAVNTARAAGATAEQYPHIDFPAFGPPPDEGGVASPGLKGKGKMTGSPTGSGSTWGSIGDRRPFGGGRDGGAGASGLAF